MASKFSARNELQIFVVHKTVSPFSFFLSFLSSFKKPLKLLNEGNGEW